MEAQINSLKEQNTKLRTKLRDSLKQNRDFKMNDKEN